LSLQDKVAPVMAVAADRLDDSYVLVGFETVGDRFQVWTAEGDALGVNKLEAAAHALLSRLVAIGNERSDACSQCPACKTRLARAHAAITALGIGPVNDEEGTRH